MDRFKPGQILRIKIKSFMTYDDLEIIPKEGLNMIIGLNGSGKSSIMSAICLGLSGKPQYTGKSAQPSDFIKLGHNKAFVEIELMETRGRSVIISRTIHEDRSTYTVDGLPTNQADVMAVVKKFNIDVSNLCQFLPQEKVVEFSKMDKKKRLENMLQSIGEPELFTAFEELKEKRTDFNAREKELKKLRNIESNDVEKNARLKHEVDKQCERKELNDRLNHLLLRETVLLYETLKDDLNTEKAKKREIAENLKKLQTEAGAIETEISEAASMRDNTIRQMKEKQARINVINDKMQNDLNALSELKANINLAKVDYQTMIDQKNNQQAQIIEIKKLVAGLKDQYQQLKMEEPAISAKKAENLAQHEQNSKAFADLYSEKNELTVGIQRLDRLQQNFTTNIEILLNEEEKKLDLLRHRYKHTYQAVIWLRQNMNTFKSTIHLPALLTIKVDDHRYCKFIENNVNIRDLLAFVCEDKDDVRRLTEILRNQKKLPVNIALAPEAGLDSFQSRKLTTQMKSFGIQCFIKDIFTAPDPVVCYLCQIYNLQQVPICSGLADNYVEEILNLFRVFFMENERISGTISRYGNQKLSVKRDHIVPKNILQNADDQSQELQRLQTQLKDLQGESGTLNAKLENCLNGQKELEKKLEQIRLEKQELKDKEMKIKSFYQQYRQREDILRRREAAVINEEEEKAKETEKVQALNAQKRGTIETIISRLEELHALMMAKTKGIPFARIVDRQVAHLAEKIRKKRDEIKIVERDLEKKRQEIAKVKEDATKYYRELQTKNKELILQAVGDHSSYEEVVRQIENIRAQLELNFDEDEEVINDYNKREEQIEKTQKQIKTEKKKLDALLEEINQKKTWWLQKLDRHINNINTKFAEYYKFLQCAGEVILDKTDDTNNFLDYGLQIRLKYRANEDFIELSQTHHSGGECSVAAIIFILSLQELTSVPFRCIDEINQGMDSVNERKIYELIADASKSGSSCSQYFLLTPKLLMDLSYNKGVAVHIVFNSRFLGTKLDVRKILKKAKENR